VITGYTIYVGENKKFTMVIIRHRWERQAKKSLLFPWYHLKNLSEKKRLKFNPQTQKLEKSTLNKY
jgi:hypothetical protein